MNRYTKMLRVDEKLHERLLKRIEKTGQTLTFVTNQAVKEWLEKAPVIRG